MKKEPPRVIPKAKIQLGIERCKTNINDFLKDALLILDDKRLNHAYVLVEFAIEELGKALFLKDALASGSDPVLVDDRVFRSHWSKDEKAWTFLDQRYKTIFEGDFDSQDFDYRDFVTETTASHETRLHCAFVDYYEDEWFLGRDINEELLLALINHIEAKVATI
jgi:AbiV family abortive infection protein